MILRVCRLSSPVADGGASIDAGVGVVYHSKVLFGVKTERNQWVFFVVKGIIGQRYYDRSKFRFQN